MRDSLVGAEAFSAIIASGDDVIEAAAYFDSGLSWHASGKLCRRGRPSQLKSQGTQA